VGVAHPARARYMNHVGRAMALRIWYPASENRLIEQCTNVSDQAEPRRELQVYVNTVVDTKTIIERISGQNIRHKLRLGRRRFPGAAARRIRETSREGIH
jgi:hypothetical protein